MDDKAPPSQMTDEQLFERLAIVTSRYHMHSTLLEEATAQVRAVRRLQQKAAGRQCLSRGLANARTFQAEEEEKLSLLIMERERIILELSLRFPDDDFELETFHIH